MVEDITISPADAHDIEPLVNLVNSAYRGDSSRIGWTTEADLLDGIRIDEPTLAGMLYAPESVVLKCSDVEGKLIGCVYLQKHAERMYLGMLTVSPYQQARGIGKALLSASEHHAKKHNCSSIYMTVITIRHELIAWYERQGFHKTGSTKPFPNDPRFGIPKQPLEFMVMEKLLI